MQRILREPVSVITSYNHKSKEVRPISLSWHNQTFPILQVGLHHSYQQGASKHHVFSVTSDNLFFRLNLNTENLHWTIEEISDGLPD